MNITIDDIQPHLNDGKTAEQILAILQADTRHARDVKATGGNIARGEFDLHHVLVARLGVIRQGVNGWKGPLAVAMDALDDEDQLKVGFEKLLANLTVVGRDVFCHSDPKTGALVTGITGITKGLVTGDGADEWAENVQSEVDALTGGLLYAGVTLDQIKTAIADAASDARKTAWIGRLNDAITASDDELRSESATVASVVGALAEQLGAGE
ncbi:hypothetical protein [Rosistilla oblonga]|uniref:hypothetical protein n=1 Tax=Rosistilla oblonga TaxID=2527990 RepID=UPI003A97BE71